MRGLAFRIMLTCINIFFPPLSVMILTGLEWDCMMNCCLFLLAIIPSHIHGFYISCTYFHRRRKVKKGIYPGGPKSLIHSSNVLNGGASDAEVARLRRKQSDLSRQSSKRSSSSGLGRRKSEAHRVGRTQSLSPQQRAPQPNGYQWPEMSHRQASHQTVIPVRSQSKRLPQQAYSSPTASPVQRRQDFSRSASQHREREPSGRAARPMARYGQNEGNDFGHLDGYGPLEASPPQRNQSTIGVGRSHNTR